MVSEDISISTLFRAYAKERRESHRWWILQSKGLFTDENGKWYDNEEAEWIGSNNTLVHCGNGIGEKNNCR